MNPKKIRRAWALVITLVVLIFIRLFTAPGGCWNTGKNANDFSKLEEEIRDTSGLVYTKHARCRMDCRKVEESEVKWILLHGKLNAGKSDARAHPDPKLALEGRSPEGQHLRIVFAPDHGKVVVITCIDLDKEWQCDCP